MSEQLDSDSVLSLNLLKNNIGSIDSNDSISINSIDSDISVTKDLISYRNESLQQKIKNLRKTINNLKEELLKEKLLLRSEKEVWEKHQLHIKKSESDIDLSGFGTPISYRSTCVCKKKSVRKVSQFTIQSYNLKLLKAQSMCHLELIKIGKSMDNIFQLKRQLKVL